MRYDENVQWNVFKADGVSHQMARGQLSGILTG